MSFEIGFPGEYMDNAPKIDPSLYVYGANGAPIIDEVEAEAKRRGVPEDAEFNTGFGRRLSVNDKIAWASPYISGVSVLWDYPGLPGVRIVFHADVAHFFRKCGKLPNGDDDLVHEPNDVEVFEVDFRLCDDCNDADALRHIPTIRAAWETVIRRHGLHA